MNYCFLIGRIISEIKFEFMLVGNNISISTFLVKEKNNVLKIKAYDEVADWCYQNLMKGDIAKIQGKINSKMEIIVQEIYH